MSSTQTIDFSLRRNKAIERAIAFDALLEAREFIGENPVYVGLGSLWFRDFQLAHRSFTIDTMISIESDELVFKRAEFNRPYGCIEVIKGDTTEVLPGLLERDDINARPWIVWLDYDASLDDDRVLELATLVEDLAAGSAILVTFNAAPRTYGRGTRERREALADLFGPDIIDPALPDEAFDGQGLMKTLAQGTLAHMEATSVRSGRSGPFIPAISLLYRDSSRMVTVGGFIPDKGDADACRSMVSDPSWFGIDDVVINTQPLTIREINALSQLLPSSRLTRKAVRQLGFELDDDQLRFFRTHYLRYPIYVETV